MSQVFKIHGEGHGPQKRSFDSFYQEIKKRPSSERKAKVQELHEDGVSNRAIGAKLGIDEKTVRGDLKGYLLLGDQLTPRSTKRMRQGEPERLKRAIAKGARWAMA